MFITYIIITIIIMIISSNILLYMCTQVYIHMSMSI